MPAETLRLDCATQWSLSTDAVRLGYWRCSGGTAITSEGEQPWPMISFCYGGAYVVTTDDSRCVVDCSTLLLLNHGRAYKTEAISCEQAYGTSLSVPVEALEDVLTHSKSAASASNGPDFVRVSARLDPGVRMEEGQLFEWLKNPGVFPNLAIEERALRLFAAATIDAAPDHSDASSKRRLAARKAADHTAAAKTVLADHFRDRLSLAQVAARVGISPFHLCRVFRSQTGMSLHQYVISLRLFAALEYLSESERNLADIAHSLGFAQHSHFTEAFRRRFGLTPLQARECLHRERKTMGRLRNVARRRQIIS